MLILHIKDAQKLAIFIISTLLCKMAQLYNESVLEISLNKDIYANFVPESEPSKGDPINVLLQVANLPEELMETEMLPYILP